MKKMNEQSNLSSSEDEASTNILREAIDQQFLNDDLYNTGKTQVIPSSAQINKLNESLRISSRQQDTFMNFGVTITFQNFIAKKLDEILERTTELKNANATTNYCSEQKQRKSKQSGIKLLSTSKKLLTIAKVKEDYTEHEKRSKRNRQIVKDDFDALLKFREAAIEPEHILTKLDTKAWVNRRPEPEFKYKRLKNGTLTEM